MSDTPFTRARWTAVGGLLVQLVAFAALLILAMRTGSVAIFNIAWLVLGGAPLWFIAQLLFRQREAAVLEAADLEALRREKEATGGGEAMFADERTGLGFRVSEARVKWMQRWLVPAVALVQAVYLLAMGAVRWMAHNHGGLVIGSDNWPEPIRVGLALVLLAVLMLGTFLMSRYASGMAKNSDWQILRGCGSYLLACALVIMAAGAALGVFLYANVLLGEQIVAYVVPILMVVLGFETLFNFVADFYRPASARREPRAAFDSRLLGLFAEPGGIASSIADAVNYQFGFPVSQTWFYQLLHRTMIPMLLTAAVALWLMTCIVIVRPFEHVIIERFGRQLNAQTPHGPGLHFKAPWPIEAARAFDTGRLHEVHVGFKRVDAIPHDDGHTRILQWTDHQHMSLDHFDFLIVPPADAGRAAAQRTLLAEQESETQRVPVHLMRMDVAVQYRIMPDKLDVYTRTLRETAKVQDTKRMLLNVAWEEVGRYMSSRTADELLGASLGQVGSLLRERIATRVEGIGLDVVYVGITNVHPEQSVAEAYRKVVQADQERVAAIRQALVEASEKLTTVAGNANKARAQAIAIKQQTEAANTLSARARALAAIPADRLPAYLERMAAIGPLFQALAEAQAEALHFAERSRGAELAYTIGLDETQTTVADRAAELQRAQERLLERRAAVNDAIAPIRDEAAAEFGAAAAYALVETGEAAAASQFWSERLREQFALGHAEGETARLLSEAFARRWEVETEAWALWQRARLEGEMFRSMPELYHARSLVGALVDELTPARKFFLAFDPEGREVRVRLVTDDDLRLLTEDVATIRRN